MEQDLLKLGEGKQRSGSKGRGCILSLTCHKRENDIDIHLTPQLTLVEGTLDLISWENEGIFSFPVLFPTTLFPSEEFCFAIKLLLLANTLLNYHVLSDCPISVTLSAFLLPAVVNSVVAKGEIRY